MSNTPAGNHIPGKNEFDGASDVLKNWLINFKGMTVEDIRTGFLNNLEYHIAKDQFSMTPYDKYLSLAYTIRDRLIERWINTQQQYHKKNVKRVYYLSLEFLMGRLLGNNLYNLGLDEVCEKAMADIGFTLDGIEDEESDQGLGNGGLGRLAACFLDSMATLELPAIGYGIRYEFGIFNQKIINGFQREVPERWLSRANPWEIERPEYKYTIHYNGRTVHTTTVSGESTVLWMDTDDVIAIPYDTPIPGYKNNTVNTLRLWSARSANEFNLDHFNTGDYIGACQDKMSSENISKVLYPNDSNHSGKELRLKQQYFFTSASLQDIIRRYLAHHSDFKDFARLNAIQLNDTHPAIAIVELMRLLLDKYKLEWDESWEIVSNTFAYTNHTLMPEALETWSVSLMRQLLPRHMELIYEINSRFLRLVSFKYPGDTARLTRMSLIEESGEQKVRMAYLAIVASHSVNGVAELHTKLLIQGLVKDFYEMWPEKFNNKTNGITQRRWLHKCNRPLSELITQKIGDSWIKDLSKLKQLEKYKGDKDFMASWQAAKRACKERLAEKLMKWNNIVINTDHMFDVQVKRMHEYKRQLLNAMHCIHLYNRIKAGDTKDFVPRTVFIGGKAAPGYYMAKLIIKFINSIAATVNHDPATKGLLNVHFLPNYRVSLAEAIMPASDLSEQISTAGTEASGTGNMKFGLNGAMTIGTMDGANIEMWEEVGDENIFIFGLRAHEVDELHARGYNPNSYYDKSPNLKRVIDLISCGFFSPEEPGLFTPLIDTLLRHGDKYMIMADFDSYVASQEKASTAFRDVDRWTNMSIHNVANMGKFSSDRTIKEYANDIWHAKPLEIKQVQ
jgi:starch phosphorylase